MRFFRWLLGIEEFEDYQTGFIIRIEENIKNTNNTHEEILCMISQIHDKLEKTDHTKLNKKLDCLDENVLKLNTMTNELKGVVSFVRADWNKQREEERKPKRGRPKKEQQ